MAVITINAEFASNGYEIAQKLAEELEYIYFDQIIADEIAHLIKTNKLNVEQFEEQNHQTIFATLTKYFSLDIFTLKSEEPKEKMREKLYSKKIDYNKVSPYEINYKGINADIYKKMLYKIINSLAQIGDCIIVGRGSNIILRGEPDTYHFRIIASKKLRIKNVMENRNCSEKEAEKLINEIDKKAYNYNKYYFDFDVKDPNYYSAVLNVDLLGENGIIKLIKNFIKY